MDNTFRHFFDSLCQIQKTWSNIQTQLSPNSTQVFCKIEAKGPFEYISSTKNSLKMMLFTPHFTPFQKMSDNVNADDTKNCLLVQSNNDRNFHFELTFSDEEELLSFQSYWYESAMFVEDMISSINLMKYPLSEKIMYFNTTSKIFQEVICVIQAISTIVFFQTQFFNGAEVRPGISIQITKDFISGIVEPFNCDVPDAKKNSTFYIKLFSAKPNENKLHYFVCPSRESLMRWVLTLYALAGQTKTEQTIITDENEKITFLMDKINGKLNEEKERLQKIEAGQDRLRRLRHEEEEEQQEMEKIAEDERIREIERHLHEEEEEKLEKERKRIQKLQEEEEENEEEEKKDEEEKEKEEEKEEENNINNENINENMKENVNFNNNLTVLSSEPLINTIPLPDSISFDEVPQIFESDDDEEHMQKERERQRRRSIIVGAKDIENNRKNSSEKDDDSSKKISRRKLSEILDEDTNAIKSNAFAENENYYYQMWAAGKKPSLEAEEAKRQLEQQQQQLNRQLNQQENQQNNDNTDDNNANKNNNDNTNNNTNNTNNTDNNINTNNDNNNDNNDNNNNDNNDDNNDDDEPEIIPPSSIMPILPVPKPLMSKVKSSSLNQDQFISFPSSYISYSSMYDDEDDESMDVSDSSDLNDQLHSSSSLKANSNDFGKKISALIANKDTTGIIAEVIADTSDERPIDNFEQILESIRNSKKTQQKTHVFTFPNIKKEVSNYSIDDVPNLLSNSANLYQFENEGNVANDAIFDYNSFEPFVEKSFDNIISDSIDRLSKENQIDLNFFKFSDFPNFDPEQLNAYNEPSSPYFTELMIEINSVLKHDIKSIPSSVGAKFSVLLASLFLNGLKNQTNSFFFSSLIKLEELVPLISPVVRLINEKDSHFVQALDFVVMILNRRLLTILFREIQHHEEWIKEFYLPSSLMLYGNQLSEIINELSNLRDCDFNLNKNDISVTETLNKFSTFPSFPFTIIDDCDGSIEKTVAVFIELLEEGQIGGSSLQYLNTNERNAWKFISDVGEIDNTNENKEFSIFQSQFQNLKKGGNMFETNRNFAHKLKELITIGYQLGKLHIWFMLLAVHKQIVAKYYSPCATIADMFRIRYVVAKLMSIMKQAPL